MEKVNIRLTVFFENPFWVGVFERIVDGEISASKFVFGKEPSDNEIYDLINTSYTNLKFSSSLPIELKNKKLNPKRAIREANKELNCLSRSTKSHQALKLLQEQNKLERKRKSKEEKIKEKEYMVEKKVQKRKKKHKGK